MFDARHISHRRRAMLVAAIFLVPLGLLGLRHPEPAVTIGWSLALAAVLVAAALVTGRARLASPAYYVAAIASAAGSVQIVVATGGVDGPRFGFLLALPPVVLCVVPELPWASVLTGAVSVGGALLIIAREGRGAGYLAEFSAVALLVLALSGAGAFAFRRLWYDQLQVEARHARVLAQLAESERLRARAERVSLVAKLAARLAHELNNPLAVVQANVRYLSEPRPGCSDPAVAEAAADTLASAERIGVVAAELRALASVVPGDTGSCDVAVVLREVVARLDGSIRERIEVRVGPGVGAVLDCALLGHCVRQMVLGAVWLDGSRTDGWLSLDAAEEEGSLTIALLAGAPGQPGEGGLAEPGAADCGRAGLHLALAEELAQSLGGGLRASRLGDGTQRLVVALPTSPGAPSLGRTPS